MLPSEFINRVASIIPCPQGVESLFLPKVKRSFRVNTLKTNVEEIFQLLKDQGMTVEYVSWCPYAFIVGTLDADKLFKSPLYSQGKIYAQGLESMMAPIILDPKPDSNVLDLCAAPGSKTTQIAAMMCNQGRIIANEPVRARLFKLKSVMELLGARAALTSKDGRIFKGERAFDAILVDAPCSSEGRFCLDDAKSYAYWSVRKVHEMAHKQKGLLFNALRLLKDGGTLVYSTCTFGREENEEVVEWLLKKAQGRLKLVPIKLPDVPQYLSTVQGCLRVMPTDTLEGFFCAKFSS